MENFTHKPGVTVERKPVTLKNPQKHWMSTICGTSYVDSKGKPQTCTSMMLLRMPLSHCPNCHHVARLKKLTPPFKCFKCGFNLMRWRLVNGVNDPLGAEEFGPVEAEDAA